MKRLPLLLLIPLLLLFAVNTAPSLKPTEKCPCGSIWNRPWPMA